MGSLQGKIISRGCNKTWGPRELKSLRDMVKHGEHQPVRVNSPWMDGYQS